VLLEVTWLVRKQVPKNVNFQNPVLVRQYAYALFGLVVVNEVLLYT